MFGLKNMAILVLGAVGLMSCAYPYERVYEIDEPDMSYNYEMIEQDPNYSSLPCQKNGGGFLKSRLWSDKEMIEVCSIRNQPKVNAAGVKLCPPNKRCPDDGRLPPQPCAQPMPAYYGDISSTAIADGIVLIHPYTRTQVVCFDLPGESAVDCAQNFKGAGYVLITDLPQLPAPYDFLRDGTYPTRRWRGGGEVVPRW